MDQIERTGRSVEEAVADALSILKASKDEVEVTVLHAGTKGFLGLGSKPAHVIVKKIFNPAYTAKNFIKEVTMAMGILVDIETSLTEKSLSISLSGENAGKLIGKHGQTLDSLQYLISLVVNKGSAPFVNIILDCENYREKRKETLENLARNLAKKAKATRKNIVLEPMTSYERRIIHSTLQNDKTITTFSEGEEPYRNVVISPKFTKSYQN